MKPKNVLINNVDDLFYERTLSSHFYNLVKSYYNRNVDINSYNLELPRKIFNSFYHTYILIQRKIEKLIILK